MLFDEEIISCLDDDVFFRKMSVHFANVRDGSTINSLVVGKKYIMYIRLTPGIFPGQYSSESSSTHVGGPT